MGAKFNPGTSKDGWLVTPDNIAFDPKGRAWICTDGANDFDLADGVYACDTEGEGRALTRLFFACPSGAEATGACFTPDGRAMFVSVQHPGENSETLAKPHHPLADHGPEAAADAGRGRVRQAGRRRDRRLRLG